MRKLWISTIVIVFLVCNILVTIDNPVMAQDKPTKHLVPADKGLSQDAVQLLLERGQQEVYRGKGLDTIGM
ncbi:MAG: hypothetical protein ACYS3N_09655, partial [Planctomycetota bacterium]